MADSSAVGESRLSLPRRQVLIAAATGAVAAAAVGGAATSASAATPAADSPASSSALDVQSAIAVAVLTTGFGSYSTIRVPAIVDAQWPADWGRRMIVTASFDPRLLVAGGRATVTQDLTLSQSVSVSTTMQGSLAVATFALTLATRDRPIALHVALPLRARQLFPQEDVGPASPVGVTIAEAGVPERSFSATSSCSAPTPVVAWALDLFGLWGQVDVRQRGSGKTNYKYRHPVGVEVVSLGPGPSPADAAVSLAVDSRIIGGYSGFRRDIHGRQEPRSAVSSVSGEVLNIVVPIGRSLKAGERIRIDLTPTQRSSHPSISSLRNATLSVVSTDTPALWRRATPNDTAVDLTASGRADVEHEALGTV